LVDGVVNTLIRSTGSLVASLGIVKKNLSIAEIREVIALGISTIDVGRGIQFFYEFAESISTTRLT